MTENIKTLKEFNRRLVSRLRGKDVGDLNAGADETSAAYRMKPSRLQTAGHRDAHNVGFLVQSSTGLGTADLPWAGLGTPTYKTGTGRVAPTERKRHFLRARHGHRWGRALFDQSG